MVNLVEEEGERIKGGGSCQEVRKGEGEGARKGKGDEEQL